MSNVGNLNIQLSLDSAKFTQGMNNAKNSTQRFAKDTQSQLASLDSGFNSLGKKLTILAADTLGSYAANSVQKVVGLADSYTELGNRLRLVTDGDKEHAQAMQSVVDVSLKTHQTLGSTGAVYQRIAQNAEALHLSQAKVASITETVSKAVAISGATTQAADAALMQFGQSLANGVFRGDEFNSVMEQTPGLAQAMADGLGVTIGQFRAMANAGQLTNDVIIKALENAKGGVDEKFGRLISTISSAWNDFNSSLTVFVGEADQTIGVSKGIVSVMGLLSQNLGSVATVAGSVGAAFATVKFTQKAQEALSLFNANRQNAQAALASAQSVRQQAAAELEHARAAQQSLAAQLKLAQTEQQRLTIRKAMSAQSAQIIALSKAETAASVGLATAQKNASLFSSAISFMGGPIGIATTGLALGASAIYEWYTQAEQAKQKSLDFANSLTELNAHISTMSSLELKVSIADTEKSATEWKNKIQDLENELDKLREKASQKIEFDIYTGASWEKDLQQQKEEMDAVTRKTLELENAKKSLASVEASLSKQMEALPVSELKARIEALNPQVDVSKINFESLGWTVDQLNTIFPQASAQGSSFMGIVSQLGVAAMVSAGKFDVLASSIANATNAKLQSTLDDNNLKIEINNAKASGNTKLEKELTAKRNVNNKLTALGIQKGSEQEKQLYQSELAVLQSQPASKKGKGKSGGHSLSSDLAKLKHDQTVAGLKGQAKYLEEAKFDAAKKGYKGKDADAYIDQYVKTKMAEESNKGSKGKDYKKQFTKQLTEMQNRLATLKASTGDMRLYGQTSQYQEVSKLTADIAENAEKYKNYGVEGVKKLQDMAAKIDDVQQQFDISQFAYTNTENLKSLEFELTLLGKTRTEQELIQYNHDLDLEAAKLKVGMSKENIALLDQEILRLKTKRAEIQQQAEAQRSNPVLGIQQGLNTIQDDVTNVAENMSSITTSAFGSMADALTDLSVTGKASFSDMAQSILSDISKMIIKMLLFKAIQTGASLLFGYQGATTTVSGSTYGMGSWDSGGYTGDGGKYDPAGIVHRGEYVLTKEATSRLGLDYLNYLNYGARRGFANGGGVGVPRVPNTNYGSLGGGATSNQVTITINIDSSGNTSSDVKTAEEAKSFGKAIEAKVMEVLVQQKRKGNLLS